MSEYTRNTLVKRERLPEQPSVHSQAFDAHMSPDAKAEIPNPLRTSNRAEEVAHLVQRYERFERLRRRDRQLGPSQVSTDRHSFRRKVGDCRCDGRLTDKWNRVHKVFFGKDSQEPQVKVNFSKVLLVWREMTS